MIHEFRSFNNYYFISSDRDSGRRPFLPVCTVRPMWKKYSHQPENSSWSGFSADLEIPKSPPKSAEICCGFANFEKSCANPQRAADLKEQHSQIRSKLHLYMKMQIRGILLWIIPIQRKFLSSKKFFRLAIRDYAMGTSWQSMSITSLAPSAVV